MEATGTKVSFDDGTSLDVRSVIWATGFGVDHSWIDVPVLDAEGRLVHRRGVTGSPGFYFLGLTWQHTRGSALLGWVKDDADYIAQRIAGFPPNAPAETRGSGSAGKTSAATVGAPTSAASGLASTLNHRRTT